MERRVALLAAVAVLLVATPLYLPTDVEGARPYSYVAEPVEPADAAVPDDPGPVSHAGRLYEVDLRSEPTGIPVPETLSWLAELAVLVDVPPGLLLFVRAREAAGDGPPEAVSHGSVDGSHDRSVAVAVLAVGVGCLLAAVFLPAAPAPVATYDAESLSDDAAADAEPEILECGGDVVQRECAFEARVRADGTVAASVPSSATGYRFVRFPDGYYRANETSNASATRLSLSRTSRLTAYRETVLGLRTVAEPVWRAVLSGDPVRAATEPHRRSPHLVRVDDQVYRVTQQLAPAPFRTPLLRWVAKLVLLGAGLALVWNGWGRRHASRNQK